MASKKEVLKLYRLETRPSYLASESPAGEQVRGYINYHEEFKGWDVEYTKDYDPANPPYANTAPRDFFTDDNYNYSAIAFVIDGEFSPYHRAVHDLTELQDRIYILRFDASSTGLIHADPFISTNPKKVFIHESETTPKTLSFWINPNNLKLIKRKLFQQIRTRAGWAFQHWGPQIGEIHLEGTTGNISATPQIQMGTVAGIPFLPQVVDEIPTEQNSPALRAFRAIESWYDEDQDEGYQENGYLTAIEYRGRAYVGHIAEFSYEERNTHPFQLFYRLKFMVHYDAGNLQAATSRARRQIVRNEETLRYLEGLKATPEEEET